MKQINRTQDNLVTKYIHDDGSETAIKTVPSIKATKTENGSVTSEYVERNKYSIFISISTGCHFSCNFCHLTMKGAKYIKLSAQNVIDNVKEAIDNEITIKPELADKYVKLSFMGMGDAFGFPEKVDLITRELTDYILSKGYAIGIDGVDISTVMPPKIDIENARTIYTKLNTFLMTIPLNPNSFKMDNIEQANITTYTSRTPLRMFYSIGNANIVKRDRLIPNTMELKKAIATINTICGDDINLIFHYMFIEGENSDTEAVDEFLSLYSSTEMESHEVRILRYNSCNTGWYEESGGFQAIIDTISPAIDKLKIQRSLGSEVKAACGEFLVTEHVEPSKFKSIPLKILV
jgi:adenine C2-methylase RlmN of 23S rRNA A2503 and tRNA A37